MRTQRCIAYAFAACLVSLVTGSALADAESGNPNAFVKGTYQLSNSISCATSDLGFPSRIFRQLGLVRRKTSPSLGSLPTMAVLPHLISGQTVFPHRPIQPAANSGVFEDSCPRGRVGSISLIVCSEASRYLSSRSF